MTIPAPGRYAWHRSRCGDRGRRGAGAVGWWWRPILLLLLAALACRPPPPVDPVDFQDRVLRPAVGNWRGLESLMAFGEIELEADGKRFAGRLRALYVAPGRIRLDAELPGFFGLLGGTGTLWAGPDGIWWRSGTEAGLHAGLEDPIFGPMLGRPPTAHDLEVMLFALPAWWPPVDESADDPADPRQVMSLQGDPGAGEMRLEWPDGTSERGQVSGRPPVLRTLTRIDSAGTQLTLQFDAYQEVAELALPGRLILRSPRTGGHLRLRWRRFEANRSDAVERLQWPLQERRR